ncbi:MAG TPA: chromate efflux transporter [Sphingomicrobium sp.]|nr:chromate efflux transporter [Sphingomicrobium sp.]
MSESRPTLAAIFARFARFGLLAWGGPVAQIAMVKRELVEEEQWLTPERFNRLLAVYQVLPGPEAHELCVHLGMMKRGRLGGLLAGLGFMLPGLLLILALAWIYQRLNLDRPLVAAIFLGVQIGVIALIVRAVHRIGDHVLTDRWLWAVAMASAIGSLLGVSFWIVLPVAGLAYSSLAAGRHGTAAGVALAGLGAAIWFTGPIEGLAASPHLGEQSSVGALALFVSGLKAGLLTFGGAYTAIPFVRHDAVGRGWVNEGQFLDSLALGGVIPAPLIIFATFVGYLAGGLGGALAITAGIFLPAFSFALLFYDRLERVIEDERLHNLLEGVAAGVVGLIAVTALQLGWNVAKSVPSPALGAAIFAASLALLYLWKSKLNVLAVVGGAGALGALFVSGAP